MSKEWPFKSISLEKARKRWPNPIKAYGRSPMLDILQEAQSENAARTEELLSLGKSVKPK